MARIGFEVEGYPVSVSTQGYFSVGSPTTPDGVLYGASVRELGHGIHWNGDEDEVVPDIEDPLVRQAAEEWVASHRDLLAKRTTRPKLSGASGRCKRGRSAV